MSIIFRRSKLTDFLKIKKLFFSVFKRSISKHFYDWRYLENSKYNSFVVFDQNKLIGHVGFVRYELNQSLTKNKKYIFSRHTSMIHANYRKKNIYSKLLKFSFSKLQNNNFGFLVWPNNINYIVIKKTKNYYKIPKHYIYSINIKSSINKKNNSNYYLLKFNEIFNMEYFFKSNNQKSIFQKNYKYFIHRYLSYDNKNYKFIVKKINNQYLSLFVLEMENMNNKVIIKIFDFYSIKNNFNNEINYLINFLKGYYKSRINIKILFWHSKLIERSILSNKINRTKKSFNICLIPNLKKKNLINNLNFNFFMGDTDVFININKKN